MDSFDVPIFKKAYDFYREFYSCLKNFPKADRYALGQKCELTLAELLENLLRAGAVSKPDKALYLETASVKLNLLRVYVRLAKDIRALDSAKYASFQQMIDEIGRMLGGWRRSLQ